MPPNPRRPATPTTLTALALSLALVACAPKATAVVPVGNPARGTGGGDLDKLTADLIELHQRYQAYLGDAAASGQAFAAGDAALLVADERVAVDATATGDPERLERDLVALGLLGAARVGPVVSGYLPIAALPEAAALSTLRHLRAVKAGLR